MNEEELDKEMVWLHLDPETYYDSSNITTFLILTKEQFSKVKRWTLENIKKYEEVGEFFSDSDKKKLGA